MADSPRSILFVAGDLSGDMYSARLVRRVAERHPDWTLNAVGGKHLGAAVVNQGRWIGDTTRCSAIGLSASIPLYFPSKAISERMRKFVHQEPTDAVVLCDWGGFNCRQLDFFKKQGVPVLYYFPPRSWQRTGRAGLSIASQVRRVATPFEWSAQRLRAAGCQAEWVGHPLLERPRDASLRETLRRGYGVRDARKLVALLPGSREDEFIVLAPRLAAAARLIQRKHNARFVVAVPADLAEKARTFFPESTATVIYNAADALLACDAAVVKCGSATLEAAVMGAPQVAVYDFAWIRRLEWLAFWMWKKIRYVAMPNIILQRMAVPELLGRDCRPSRIAHAVGELLTNDAACKRMLTDYEAIRRALGSELPFTATERTAEILDEMLGVTNAPADAEPYAEP